MPSHLSQVRVHKVEGNAYDLKGRQASLRRNVEFDTESFNERRVLPPAEAEKLLTTFR